MPETFSRKFLLLGSGELGREFVIAAKRLGQYVTAVDSYENAPAMQLADDCAVIDMLDGKALDALVKKIQPDFIVPEVEAIATDRLYEYESQGIHVVPSARATNFTMNRKAIRDLAAQELGILTADYRYADSESSLAQAVEELGLPCVVKPLMSSSGKGQSVIKTLDDIPAAWSYAASGARAAGSEVIVEQFIEFESEITLLTVTQKNGPTVFCPPIGHVQERGDYQSSWQPADISNSQLQDAAKMAEKVTGALTGAGLWGVEFFLGKDDVYFSELSPRPHDTGMVTLAGTQNFNEFELHLRAILGLPISEIILARTGASAVILAPEEPGFAPAYNGINEAASDPNSQIFIFNKPVTRPYRRMGVVASWGEHGEDPIVARSRAIKLANSIEVVPAD